MLLIDTVLFPHAMSGPRLPTDLIPENRLEKVFTCPSGGGHEVNLYRDSWFSWCVEIEDRRSHVLYLRKPSSSFTIFVHIELN